MQIGVAAIVYHHHPFYMIRLVKCLGKLFDLLGLGYYGLKFPRPTSA